MADFIIPLLIFLLPLAYSPGPGNLFFAANGARFGFMATLPANLGYHGATFAVTLAIGLGFGQLSSEAPNVFIAIRYAGTVYVLWLAFRLWRPVGASHEREARPASAIDGAMLLILNPKAYVIIGLMFSQFLASGSDATGRLFAISTIFTLNNAVAFSLYAILADRLAAQWRDPGDVRHINRFFAALLTGVAVWMLSS
ncbi:LysE family translocator [Fulvimarina sp. MAC8]|uniref:LysE family translocator n=1 Tax=Fulvimarina sp. MAC8 TaxID=3162874 RepID=UPI0032EDF320